MPHGLYVTTDMLRIETGRYSNERIDERVCLLCNSGDVENEMHFLYHCNLYLNTRQLFYDRIESENESFPRQSDVEKTIYLFENKPRQFGKYVKTLMSLRKCALFKT